MPFLGGLDPGFDCLGSSLLGQVNLIIFALIARMIYNDIPGLVLTYDVYFPVSLYLCHSSSLSLVVSCP